MVKRIAGQAAIPSIQDRIALYKAQKVAAMNARMPAPKPTTALLLSEIQVIGTDRREVMPPSSKRHQSNCHLSCEPFYDGQLVAIEDNRLVFRRETVFTDGRRDEQSSTNPATTNTGELDDRAHNPSVATAQP